MHFRPWIQTIWTGPFRSEIAISGLEYLNNKFTIHAPPLNGETAQVSMKRRIVSNCDGNLACKRCNPSIITLVWR